MAQADLKLGKYYEDDLKLLIPDFHLQSAGIKDMCLFWLIFFFNKEIRNLLI